MNNLKSRHFFCFSPLLQLPNLFNLLKNLVSYPETDDLSVKVLKTEICHEAFVTKTPAWNQADVLKSFKLLKFKVLPETLEEAKSVKIPHLGGAVEAGSLPGL